MLRYKNKTFKYVLFILGILKVKTAKDCEGIYEKNIGDLLSTNNPELNISLIKNPVKDFIEIYIPTNVKDKNVDTVIFDMTGKMVYKQRNELPYNSFNTHKKIKLIYLL